MIKRNIIFLLVMLIIVSPMDHVKLKRTAAAFLQNTINTSDSAELLKCVRLANHYFAMGHMDSVEIYLKQARLLNENCHIPGLQTRIKILFAKHYSTTNPGQDAKSIFFPLIKTCKKEKDAPNEALAWFELAHQINYKLDSSFKLNCFHNAMLLYGNVGLIQDKMTALRNVADIHLQQRKYDLAESELFQILKAEKSAGTLNVLGSYDLLAAIHMTKGNYDKGLYYALETVKLMKATGDSAYAPTYYSRLGSVYAALGKYSEASEWAKKCVENLYGMNYLDYIYPATHNVVDYLLKQENPKDALQYMHAQIAKRPPIHINDQQIVQRLMGDCYNRLSRYDLAEKYYLEMIRLGNEKNPNLVTVTKDISNYTIGQFYYKRSNYIKAHFYLDLALKSWSDAKTRPLQQLMDIHLALFRGDSALGNYIEAIRNLQQGNKIRDSIFTVAKNKQIEELQISYETEQKDSLINLKEQNIQLLTREDQLQKTKLQQGAILRNISFAFVALLIIIMALLYNRYRLKQRTNQKLELQQHEISKQNLSLQHLVNEKEWLLKEIHHRVKNNLQIVMSLLNSQSAYIDNEPALTAIHDSQHRVHAMSLIHQKLYNTENVSNIDMSSYIRELVYYLSDSFNTGQRIRFEYNIDPLEMDVSQAVPLGLILNEAITNSIKYAFPDGRDGVISISLSNTAPDHYSLSISDNGVGMPVHVKDKKPGSLGMSLMAGLSEDIDGSFSIENNNGAIIKITFVHNLTVKRPDISASAFVNSN